MVARTKVDVRTRWRDHGGRRTRVDRQAGTRRGTRDAGSRHARPQPRDNSAFRVPIVGPRQETPVAVETRALPLSGVPAGLTVPVAG